MSVLEYRLVAISIIIGPSLTQILSVPSCWVTTCQLIRMSILFHSPVGKRA